MSTVPHSDVLARFFRRVDKASSLRGCWLWTGGKAGTTGYGKIYVGDRNRSVHRFAYATFVGPIPDGLGVLHKCDVRNCVNPDHLFLGTKGDNNHDRAEKGRSADRRGEAHPLARLTDAAVLEIKRLRDREGLTFREIAARFGVSDSAAEYAYSGRTWRHLS